MHLGQGKNCKYVLKTPGLNTEVSEFNTEKSLDIYIETLINNDITINGEGAIFSVDHLSHTRSLLDEVKRDVESVAKKRTKPVSKQVFHNDGEVEFEKEKTEYDLEVEIVDSIEEAVRDSDIVNLATSGDANPKIEKEWIKQLREKHTVSIDQKVLESIK